MPRHTTNNPVLKAHHIALRESSLDLTTADYVWGDGFEVERQRYLEVFEATLQELMGGSHVVHRVEFTRGRVAGCDYIGRGEWDIGDNEGLNRLLNYVR